MISLIPIKKTHQQECHKKRLIVQRSCLFPFCSFSSLGLTRLLFSPHLPYRARRLSEWIRPHLACYWPHGNQATRRQSGPQRAHRGSTYPLLRADCGPRIWETRNGRFREMEPLPWQVAVPGRRHVLSTPASGGVRGIPATEALSLDQPLPRGTHCSLQGRALGGSCELEAPRAGEPRQIILKPFGLRTPHTLKNQGPQKSFVYRIYNYQYLLH